jgi:hypothetical protein
VTHRGNYNSLGLYERSHRETRPFFMFLSNHFDEIFIGSPSWGKMLSRSVLHPLSSVIQKQTVLRLRRLLYDVRQRCYGFLSVASVNGRSI